MALRKSELQKNNKNPLLKQQMEANMQKMFQMQAFSLY